MKERRISDERHPWPSPDDPADDIEHDVAPIVLVVDDDDMVRWSTARMLRRVGYQVVEPADAEEAMICMQKDGAEIKLMLSDVIMPRKNGYDLAREVRSRWPDTEVLLFSGYTPVAMDRHGIETTEFTLLRKPVPDLPGVVARLIGPARPE